MNLEWVLALLALLFENFWNCAQIDAPEKWQQVVNGQSDQYDSEDIQCKTGFHHIGNAQIT